MILLAFIPSDFNSSITEALIIQSTNTSNLVKGRELNSKWTLASIDPLLSGLTILFILNGHCPNI